MNHHSIQSFLSGVTLTVFAMACGADLEILRPDTILFNGKIVTVDEDFSIAEAVAIRDGEFVYINPSQDPNQEVQYWQPGQYLLNFGRGTGFMRSRSGVFTGADGNTDRPSLLPGRKVTIRDDWDPLTGYYDPSAFVVAEPGFWGNLEKNAGTTPGEVTFDLSLVKQAAVGEQATVQFRTEMFNIFNRANFGTPRGQVFRSSDPDSRFGQITRTFTTSRQIRFALKISF